MGRLLKYCGICAGFFLAFSAMAQSGSFLYIQGDKTIPFYVKMEDKMQPRYGKDYCIIPKLQAGVVHLEVLFQQRAFPPQKFTVHVPENGFREFLLNKQDSGFVLYDLQQKKYLPLAGEPENIEQ